MNDLEKFKMKDYNLAKNLMNMNQKFSLNDVEKRLMLIYIEV